MPQARKYSSKTQKFRVSPGGAFAARGQRKKKKPIEKTGWDWAIRTALTRFSTPAVSSFESNTVAELKAKLGERGLNASGTKRLLIEWLEQALEDEQSSSDDSESESDGDDSDDGEEEEEEEVVDLHEDEHEEVDHHVQADAEDEEAFVDTSESEDEHRVVDVDFSTSSTDQCACCAARGRMSLRLAQRCARCDRMLCRNCCPLNQCCSNCSKRVRKRRTFRDFDYSHY
jgi:SAP domain